MPNDKNHLYSNIDIQQDFKRKIVRGTQQQFSRYSVAQTSSLNSANLQSNDIPLQKDSKAQIGIPYDDTKGDTGASTQEVLFSTYGSQYTFYNLQGDTIFAFDNLPTGRSIEFTLDIQVDSTNTSAITITFPQVANAPVLAGAAGDRYVLGFVGVNRTDPTGQTAPVQTFTFLSGATAVSGYSTIQDEGDALTQRSTINFIGAGVTAADDGTVTTVTITGGGSANQIIQGDSSVTVTDTGSNGNVITLIDGTQRYSIQSNRADFAVDNIFGLKILNFDNSLGASTITPSTSGVIWNFPDNTNKLSVNFGGNDGIAISKENTIFFSGTPGTVSAAIRLFRNETVGTPEIGDAVGTVHFDGTDISDTLQEYALINGGIRGVGLGAEEGSLVLQVAKAGALVDIMDIDSGEIIIKTLLNMNTNKISNVVNPTADQDATTKKFVDDKTFIADGNTRATVLNTGPSFIVLLNNIQKLSLQNTRMDFAALDLHGITQLNFQEDSIPASPTNIASLTPSLTGLLLNIFSTSDVYDIKFNNVEAFHVDNLRTRISSTTPNTLSAAITLFRDDPSPATNDALGDINFDGKDSAGNITTYADIIAGIVVPTTNIEEGRLTFRLQNSGSIQQIMRITLDELELTSVAIHLNEINLPADPTSNQGLIYLRDVAGTTTPFFLASTGGEQSLISGGGDVFLANSQTFTGINTFNNATNGIVMINGTKLEFSNASVSNLEIHAESNMRDPADLTITTRSGLEIDLNTGAIPDTEVFGIGDGQSSSWFLLSDSVVRFNTQITGVNNAHELYLSRDTVVGSNSIISEIFTQTKIDAATYLKITFIRADLLAASATATLNIGNLSFGVVSNNTLNTGINIEGILSSSSVKLGFYGVASVARQSLPASPTTAQLKSVLTNLGLIS